MRRHEHGRSGSNSDLVLIQTAIGDYRQAVLEILVEQLGPRFPAYAGTAYFDPSTKTQVRIGSALRLLRNHFLAGRRLLWQHGSVRAGWSPTVAILEFNPRILSVWVVLVIRGARRKRTLLWGHAWSRSGRHARTRFIRTLMRRLASGVIVYTPDQARELSAVMPKDRIFVAPNAVYRAGDMLPAEASATPGDSFLYVGRLVKAKKPDLLLRAFRNARSELPAGTRLVVVGDGPIRADVERDARDLGSAVEFVGHVGDPSALRGIYARAIASVSPGGVGLSLTQSLGFGVPMIISQNEPHGPEITAAEEGWNARFYREALSGDLERAIIQMATEREQWAMRRTEIAARCRSEYSAETMAAGILEASALTA